MRNQAIKLFSLLALVALVLFATRPGHPPTSASRQSVPLALPSSLAPAAASRQPVATTPKLAALAAAPKTSIAAKLSPVSLSVAPSSPALRDSLDSLPLAFEENRGQTDSRVKFISRGPGYGLFLTQNSAVLSLPYHLKKSPAHQPRTSSSSIWMTLVNADPAASISATRPLLGFSNYLVGNDPAKWRTKVSTFAAVQYKNIYPGIDLLYYGNRKSLEYDFIVSPGADPSAIQWNIAGASRVTLTPEGDLSLSSDAGALAFKKPLVYQQTPAGQQQIAANYVLPSGTVVSFALGAYDKSLPLVIDPVLVYSTFLGGSGTNGDLGTAIALDSQNNIYVTGETSSLDFPTTPGVLQPDFLGFTQQHPFVTKIAAGGASLVFSTFLSGTDGNGSDTGSSIAVDGSNNVWITGSISDTDFPTVNPFQNTLGINVTSSAFVSKLSADGSTLLFSTYIGGKNANDDTEALGLALDGQGAAYVTGFTTSTIFPTVSPFQVAQGGLQNAFISKFTSAGAIVYSSYLGGTDGKDAGRAIAPDSAGNAYITGYTTSHDFPTKNPFISTLGNSTGGIESAFITEVKADGSSVIYSSYLGGNNAKENTGDQGWSILVPAVGTVVLGGQTDSTNFPLAAPLQAQNNGNLEGFITKIKTDGSAPTFSTYVGGSSDDYIAGIALDAAGNLYFTGQTQSTDLATVNSLQSVLSGSTDVLLGRIKSDFSVFDYLTYIGTSGINFANGIAVDAANPVNAYITGSTNSPSYPTLNPEQPAPGPGFDGSGVQVSNAFISKISSALSTTVSVFPPTINFGLENVGTTSSPLTVTVNNNSAVSIGLFTGAFQFTGANAADFAVSTAGGTCVIGNTLPAGSSCTVELTFTPGAEDARAATLALTYNAAGANFTINTPLTGQGTNPAVSLDQTSLAFPNTPLGVPSNLFLSLTNSGGGPLVFGSARITGPDAASFTVDTFCSGSIAPQSGCGFFVQFDPTTVGAKSASLQINDNAPGSPQMVPLTGTGISTVVLAPNPIDFGTIAVGSSSGMFTGDSVLSNGTATPITISNVTVSGPNASDFVLQPSYFNGAICQTGAVVAAIGGTCNISLAFSPSAAGTRTATVTITDNGPGSPRTLALTGIGANTVLVNPNPIAVVAFAIGTKSQTFTTVENYTPSPLTVTSYAISGLNAADFTAGPFSTSACMAPASGGTCFFSVNYIPSTAGTETATLTLGFTGTTGSPIVVPLTGTLFSGAGSAGFLSTGLDFGGQLVGQTSDPASSISLLNFATTTVNISSIAITGANASDFTLVTPPSGCKSGGILKSKSQCPILITFKPGATGARTANLTATFTGAPGSPATVPLTGTGAPPTIIVSDTTVDFGTRGINAVSQQSVFLINGSALPITLSAPVAVISGTNASEFVIDPSTTCINNSTLGGNGASCGVTINFRPTIPGPATATLTIFDSDPGSPRTVTLTGNGLDQPAASVSPASLAFSPQNVGTTSGNASAALGVLSGIVTLSPTNAVSIIGPNAGDFALGSGTTCTNGLSGFTSCSITATFTPTAGGNRTATIVINDDATGAPQTILLTGTGISLGPVATLNPTSETFPGTNLGVTSGSFTIVLTNTGGSNLILAATTPVAISGANASDFALSSNTCTAGLSIAPNANCLIGVDFTPSALGARAATLTVTDNSGGTAGATQTVALSGTGNAGGPPLGVLSPASLTFTSQNVGTSSAPQTVTVTNTGGSPLVLAATNPVVINGTGDYSVATGTTCTAGLSIPSNGNCVINVVFTPNLGGTRTGTLVVTDNNNGVAGTTQTVSITGTGNVPATPTASLNPTALTFAGQNLTTTSAAQTITVTNTGTANLVLAPAPLALSGANAGDFAVAAGTTCTANLSIAANATCVINITFTPTVAGARAANLTLTDNSGGTAGTTQTAPLSGTGNAPAVPTASLAPTSLTFAGQNLTTTSAAQTITVTNTGTANLVLAAAPTALSGANAGDFAIAAGTTCTAGATIAANATCLIKITFTPTVAGARAATLTLTDNSGGTAGATQTAALSGTGNTPGVPTAMLAPLSLTFAGQNLNTTSAAQTITITNTGATNLVLSATPTALSGANAGDFAIATGTTCTANATIAANATCVINLTFTPTVAGARAATLTVTDNSGGTAGTTQTVALSGTGNAPGVPTASLAPASLTFAGQNLNTTSAAQTITVTNTGTVNLVLSATPTALSGTNAGDFAIATGTTCTASLSIAANGSCLIKITFTPTAAGARAATLTVTDNSGGTAGATQTAALAGTGNAATPTVTVTPAALAFPATQLNANSNPLTITLTNTGNSVVTFTAAAAITGPNAAEFAIVQPTTCLNASSVQPAATCVVNVVFTPNAAGTQTATLTLVDNAGTQTVALSGITASPAATVSPAAVNFPPTPLNTNASTITVTLTDSGTAPLVLNFPPIISGTNAGDFSLLETSSCNIGELTLQPGGSCTAIVEFFPTATGVRTAVLTFTDNVGTQRVPLNGSTPSTVSLTATVLNFGGQPVGVASNPLTVTLTNGGGAALNFTAAPTITGANAADFALGTGTTCAVGTPVAGSGGTCTVSVVFTAGALGARGPATLTLTDSAGTQTVALSGTGADFTIAPPTGSVSITDGGSGTFNLTITPAAGGFNGPVTFTATGLNGSALPAGLCVYFPQPNPVVLGAGGSFRFLVTTTAPGQAGFVPPLAGFPDNDRGPARPLPFFVCFSAFLAALALLLLLQLRYAAKAGALQDFTSLRYATLRRNILIPALALLFTITAVAGCGGGSTGNGTSAAAFTPRGTIQIVVTATSGNLSHSTIVTLQIN